MLGLGTKRTAALAAAILAASFGGLTTIAALPAAHAATNGTPCGPLWTDTSSDGSYGGGQQDQLDIVSGGISDNASSVQTTLTVKNLSSSVPTGATANEYYFVFSFNSSSYFTQAEVSALGVTYSYGTYSSTTGYVAQGTATGSFTPGLNGTVTVTVPSGDVGNPTGTLTASGIYGEAAVLEGAPDVGGETQAVDNDPATYDYAMGSCALSTPTPSATSSPGGQVSSGTQAFANYGSPPGFQTRDAAQRPNAGEPSIGADWKTGKIMYMAGTQVSQITFDASKVPPAAAWSDVTPAQLANASEDSILFTNSEYNNPSNSTNRTWAEDFLANPSCNANMAYTDNDGGSGGGPTGSDTNSSWVPEQCPTAEGPDHPSVGAGPYHGNPPPTATDTNEVVYYCSQNVLNAAGAECTHSENGGLTWDTPTNIFGTATTPCASIHGHIRVSPDGTMYVPNGHCGGHQGVAITQDNGSTYTYSVVPDSTASDNDPSVAADRANTIYFGYQDGVGDSHPKIAVSHDHGQHWSPSVDVGTPFNIKNAVFPDVIAGDAGRAAFAFLGTTTGGNYQQQSFRGVWYLYVAFTYDGGNTWQVVNATPDDPVQTGCVDNGGVTGAYAGCRDMLDFNDITVDKQGRVYVAYTDGCTNSTGVPASDRTSGTPPVTHQPYNCDANPTVVNDSTCATSPGGETYSEGASEYSYNDSPTSGCTYGRQSSLVRQDCGEGLFASNDPGFFEGPGCQTPSSPTSSSSPSLSPSSSPSTSPNSSPSASPTSPNTSPTRAARRVPSAPRNVTATAGDTTAHVAWSPPSSDGGSAVTGYTVTASPGGATQRVSGTSATFTGLRDWTGYTFAVMASNAAGTGQAADTNPVTPHPASVVAVTGRNKAVYVRTGSAWTKLGGIALSGPAVVTNAGQPLFLVVGSDHKIWIRGASAGWQRFDPAGYCVDRPGAALTRGVLFVACEGSDHHVYATSAALSASRLPSTTGWTSIGGLATSGPAVGVANDLVTYAVAGSRGRIYLDDGAGWVGTRWFSPAAPALGDTSGGSSVLAFEGSNHALYYAAQGTAGAWSGLSNLGGVLAGGPGVAAEATGLVFCVEGLNHDVYVRAPTTQWINLGGQVSGGVGATAD